MKPSRRSKYQPEGSFARRHGCLLIYRLDQLVDAGKLTDEQAIRLHEMVLSDDKEMEKLGEQLCKETWKKNGKNIV